MRIRRREAFDDRGDGEAPVDAATRISDVKMDHPAGKSGDFFGNDLRGDCFDGPGRLSRQHPKAVW